MDLLSIRELYRVILSCKKRLHRLWLRNMKIVEIWLKIIHTKHRESLEVTTLNQYQIRAHINTSNHQRMFMISQSKQHQSYTISVESTSTMINRCQI